MLLAIWVLFGILTAVVAHNKGNSVISGFALGLLLGPLGLLLEAITRGGYACPHCKKGVAKGATICPFCRSTLIPAECRRHGFRLI
jgi:hypothetical protein